MFAILRQAGGRRYEVDFEDDPVLLDVAMSATTRLTSRSSGGLFTVAFAGTEFILGAPRSRCAQSAGASRPRMSITKTSVEPAGIEPCAWSP